MPLQRWHKWRLFWWLVSWPSGVLLAVWLWSVRLTARVTVAGPAVDTAQPAIYISWHRHIPYLFIYHGKHRRWQLMSPAPYMAPIAVWSGLLGMRHARGAPNSRMRDSLALLQQALARGESAVIFVDGPAGPARRAKPGCVELAKLTQAPLIPVACSTLWHVEAFWRWDRALLPMPFERVEVRIGEPIRIAAHHSEAESLQRIDAALGALTARLPVG